MSIEEYSIEEYKFAKEKIRKNEEKRFTLLTLNITAFLAIIGFSSKIDPLVLPVALLMVLTLCSVFYTSQSIIQKQTTAFIIEKYECLSEFVGYEKGMNEYRVFNTSNNSFAAKDPFLLMCLFSVVSTILISLNSIIELAEKSKIDCIFYLLFLCFFYLVILFDARKRKSATLDKFRSYWKDWEQNS